ncbi:hypothetical protein C9374_006339 [Naegleria lovaniensis]|uniref:Uncharacterized protein n=1 Tax=Naegleria lovaniensis TaxID=51637 RepID=A0AA88KJB3_NAELO|nr:uncharacterized protein C9374_006339 [Naegleria lovaniensis]KAG2381350.1 hypothetical protein C9374_006339 [Naegleria lovaniensis]
MFFSASENSPNDTLRQFADAKAKKQFAAFLSSAEDDLPEIPGVAYPLNTSTTGALTSNTTSASSFDPLKEFEIRKMTIVANSRKTLTILDYYIQKLHYQTMDVISASSVAEVDKLSMKERVLIKSKVMGVARDFNILTRCWQSIEKMPTEKVSKIELKRMHDDYALLEEIVKKVSEMNAEMTEARSQTARLSTCCQDEPKLKSLEQVLPSVKGKLDLNTGVQHYLSNYDELNQLGNTTSEKKKEQHEAHLNELGLLQDEYDLE